jgi:lipase
VWSDAPTLAARAPDPVDTHAQARPSGHDPVVALHLHAWGPADAPPVLVVHGVRNTGARYRRLAEEGLPDRRVLAPDLRGHGRSTWEPPWDVDRHVADLLDLMHGQELGGVPVVAHSFGGLLALRLAAAAPDLVSQVILLDPAVALTASLCEESALADLNGGGRAGAWTSVEQAREVWLSMRPPEGHWAVEEDLATFLERGDDGLFRFRYSRLAAIVAWSEMARPPASLGRFAGPVLLVTAFRDPFVTPALREMLRREAGSRLVERGIDAGHMLFWDAFDELVAAVREALPA